MPDVLVASAEEAHVSLGPPGAGVLRPGGQFTDQLGEGLAERVAGRLGVETCDGGAGLLLPVRVQDARAVVRKANRARSTSPASRLYAAEYRARPRPLIARTPSRPLQSGHADHRVQQPLHTRGTATPGLRRGRADEQRRTGPDCAGARIRPRPAGVPWRATRARFRECHRANRVRSSSSATSSLRSPATRGPNVGSPAWSGVSFAHRVARNLRISWRLSIPTTLGSPSGPEGSCQYPYRQGLPRGWEEGR